MRPLSIRDAPQPGDTGGLSTGFVAVLLRFPFIPFHTRQFITIIVTTVNVNVNVNVNRGFI